MRRLIVFLLPLCLVACKKEGPPDATQAAVNVEVTFNFKAGCIVVAAADTANAASPEARAVEVFGRGDTDRKVNVAVFRKESWSRELKITASALEANCDGKKVAEESRTVSLETAGVQTLVVPLTATDADGDGYVPTSGGGSDCDDANSAVTVRTFYEDSDGDGVGNVDKPVLGCTAPARYVATAGDCDDTRGDVNPNRVEMCDGLDNDCKNGVDDGLPTQNFFLDEDQDGVGAGPPMVACAAPPRHVAVSGDCNDKDADMSPRNSEVCDDKDNNCNNQVDDGLPVNTYYTDADGDGYGVEAELVRKCRAPAATGFTTRSDAFDCNDGNSAVNPGAAEVCNDIDDNCVGGTDEGFNKTWYRDADGDTYGNQSDMMTACGPLSGYVQRAAPFDCNDANGAVHPDAEELCNGIDDNCSQTIDEPYTTGPRGKDQPCSDPCPGGAFVCNAAGDGTVCEAPQPTDFYPDIDKDGAGDDKAAPQPVCPGVNPPANRVANRDDCDDVDKYNRRGGTEVCDDRDNDCDADKDEDDVCRGATWRALADAAVTGRNWNTVAVNQTIAEGYPVWIAGDNGALARRNAAGEAFTSFHGACGTYNWMGSWVRPSDNHVFLAGSGGRVAEFDGVTCSHEKNVSGANDATGIVGFETGTPLVTLIYIADNGGRFHRWNPTGNPSEVDDNQRRYKDVHALTSARAFAVGHDDRRELSPILRTYTGSGNTSEMNIGTAGALSSKSLRGVWMVSSALAYAVGEGATVLRWQGLADWTVMTAPASVDYTSVGAPDPSSVYVTDTTGAIRRYTGVANTWVTHATGFGELRDIALVSPTNVWAVGPNGRVVHFPEP